MKERKLLERYKAGERNFIGVNLRGAYLGAVNLNGANLARANLTGAVLTDAVIARANLFGAGLFGAQLDGANLTRANLTGANLTRANLAGAFLGDARITGHPARLGTCRRGYELMVWPVMADGEPGISIRCENLTFRSVAEARAHWGKDDPDPLRARLRRAQLAAYEADPDAWHEREAT